MFSEILQKAARFSAIAIIEPVSSNLVKFFVGDEMIYPTPYKLFQKVGMGLCDAKFLSSFLETANGYCSFADSASDTGRMIGFWSCFRGGTPGDWNLPHAGCEPLRGVDRQWFWKFSEFAWSTTAQSPCAGTYIMTSGVQATTSETGLLDT